MAHHRLEALESGLAAEVLLMVSNCNAEVHLSSFVWSKARDLIEVALWNEAGVKFIPVRNDRVVEDVI